MAVDSRSNIDSGLGFSRLRFEGNLYLFLNGRRRLGFTHFGLWWEEFLHSLKTREVNGRFGGAVKVTNLWSETHDQVVLLPKLLEDSNVRYTVELISLNLLSI